MRDSLSQVLEDALGASVSPCRAASVVLIFVGGEWSSGKSTTAVRLASALGCANVVHTDVVRAALRAMPQSRAVGRALAPSTYETWQLAGDTFSDQALAEGFEMQCRAILPAMEQCLSEACDFGKDTVVEGLHLAPEIWGRLASERNALFVWLTCPESRLRERIIRRCETTYRGRSADRYLAADRLAKIMALNALLLRQAQDAGLPVIDIEDAGGRRRLADLVAAHVRACGRSRAD